jgi:hypothetical protein
MTELHRAIDRHLEATDDRPDIPSGQPDKAGVRSVRLPGQTGHTAGQLPDTPGRPNAETVPFDGSETPPNTSARDILMENPDRPDILHGQPDGPPDIAVERPDLTKGLRLKASGLSWEESAQSAGFGSGDALRKAAARSGQRPAASPAADPPAQVAPPSARSEPSSLQQELAALTSDLQGLERAVSAAEEATTSLSARLDQGLDLRVDRIQFVQYGAKIQALVRAINRRVVELAQAHRAFADSFITAVPAILSRLDRLEARLRHLEEGQP